MINSDYGCNVVESFVLPRGDLRAPYQDYGWKAKYLPNTSDRSITIHDPVWGEAVLDPREGDGIWWRLYHHPVVLRTLGIEQLTLPPEYSIIPGSGDFPRWESMWGSVILIRSLLDQWEKEHGSIDPREKLIYQLRTFVSDLAHTAGSHLGDWMFQGFGGPEDAHDQDLKQFLELTGIGNILELSGVSLDEVVFPEVEDFVERPSPDLCIDRLDYSVRQIAGRFFGSSASLSLTVPKHWADHGLIKLNEDRSQIVVTNDELANNLGRSFSLLTTEHFSHPVHVTILRLYAELFRYAICRDEVNYYGELGMSGGMNTHPRDSMYLTDTQIRLTEVFAGHGNNVLPELIRSLADPQRRLNSIRLNALEGVLAGHSDYPPILDTVNDHYGTGGVAPLNIDVVPTDEAPFDTDVMAMLSGEPYYLRTLKPGRYIDPWVEVGSEIVRLSSIDPRFKNWLDGYRIVSGQCYQARLGVVNRGSRDRLLDEVTAAREEWHRRMGHQRADPGKFMEIIRQAATSALHSSADYGSREVGYDPDSAGASWVSY